MEMIQVLEKENLRMKCQLSTPLKDPETSTVQFSANNTEEIKQKNILTSEEVDLHNKKSGKNIQNVDVNT